MGQWLSVFDARRHQVVMLGLDNAGKSTIIYRLKMKHFVQQAPTVGFNCEKFRINTGDAKGHCFTIWDIGGQEKMRPLWKTYIRQADVVIYVVDSTEQERFHEARIELCSLLRFADLSSHIPVLLLANKQDLPGAVPYDEVKERVAGDIEKRPVQAQACCAVTGEGLDDFFLDLHQLISSTRKTTKKR